jgi:hypothetical protein
MSEEEVVHVTPVPSGGWVVVSAGGTRSPRFMAQSEALEHALLTAATRAGACGQHVAVRIQDARGKWAMHGEPAPVPAA